MKPQKWPGLQENMRVVEGQKEDVRQMNTMCKAKAGVTRIAKSLKRTPGATSVLARSLA
jgi:hypothetical protein